MQFIYLDAEGNPCGPVDESDIVKMILEGYITGDTAIRSSLLPDYRTVAELDNFKDALAQSPWAAEQQEIPTDMGVIARLKLASQPDRAKAESTAYQGKFRVADASVSHRLYAAALDCLIFAIVGSIFCAPGFSRLRNEGEIARYSIADERAEEDPGNADLTFEEDGAAENVARRYIAPGALRRMDDAIEKRNAQTANAAEYGTPDPQPERRTARPAQSSRPARQAADTVTRVDENDPDIIIVEGPERFVNKSQPKLLGKVLPSRFPRFSFYDTKILQDGRIQIRLNDDQVLRVTADACNAAFTWPCFWLLFFVLLYYTISFAVFAQSVGMWFWGIFLTRTDEREVYFLRALAYAALLPVLGIFMIPSVLIFRRSPADLICGVRQLNIYSATK